MTNKMLKNNLIQLAYCIIRGVKHEFIMAVDNYEVEYRIVVDGLIKYNNSRYKECAIKFGMIETYEPVQTN